MGPKAENQQQEEDCAGRRSLALPGRRGNDAPHNKAPDGQQLWSLFQTVSLACVRGAAFWRAGNTMVSLKKFPLLVTGNCTCYKVKCRETGASSSGSVGLWLLSSHPVLETVLNYENEVTLLAF